MSERQALAQRIADFIVLNSLTIPYGGDVIKNAKHYTVLFARPKVLDGAVNVYGAKFIQITFQTAYRDLPRNVTYIFESEANAVDFLNKAFVMCDFQSALSVPRRTK